MRNLKNIYVQDPNNADDVIEIIKGFFPAPNINFTMKESKIIEYIPKTFTDQFFIPIEF